jgi:hypothetical protein
MTTKQPYTIRQVLDWEARRSDDTMIYLSVLKSNVMRWVVGKEYDKAGNKVEKGAVYYNDFETAMRAFSVARGE